MHLNNDEPRLHKIEKEKKKVGEVIKGGGAFECTSSSPQIGLSISIDAPGSRAVSDAFS